VLILCTLTLFLTACGSRTDDFAVNETVAEQDKTEAEGTMQETETEVTEQELSEDMTENETVNVTETGDVEGNIMKITAGDTVFTATLADNSSAEALKELLSEGSLTINMSDYGSMEKVGPIGTSLPRNDEQIATEAGDIILYQGSSLVIYYDTNSWNFTRIGKIEGVTGEELLEAFGGGDLTVTFSLE